MKITFQCKTAHLGDEIAIAYNDSLSSVVYRPEGSNSYMTLTPFDLKEVTINKYNYYLHHFLNGRLHQVFSQPTQLQG